MKILVHKVSAGITGFESPAKEYIDVALSLDQLLISHSSATFFAQAKGSSMTAYGIFSGDLLIVDRAASPTRSDIVVAALNGEFVCKKIDRDSKTLLSSGTENKQYQLSDEDDYQEEGIVISSIRLHRALAGKNLCTP